MTLVLRGLSLNDEPLSNPLVGRFDDRGGEIGRSDNATFTLPDPERLISRMHARISHSAHTYWIENVSAAGQILHNGRLLSSGMRVSLNDGDELKIGGYRLTVAFENDETSATILRGRTAQTPPRALPVQTPPVQSPPVLTPRMGGAPVRSPVAEPARVAASLSADAATPVAPVTPVTPVTAVAPVASGAARAVAPNRGTKAARVRPATDAFVSADVLWRGFQDGVGVELPLPTGPSPELFSAIGAMLRIAVNGIHRLIAMRTAAKSEMHADLTMIQVRGNNPLKFAPEAAVALKMLLQPPVQGFMSGPVALRDAVIDLQSHQIGVMAGMRAALGAVLERFDPVQLETQLSSRSFIDALIPSNRRAKLWELYVEHARSLREEAQEDFNRLFGEAFLEAYNAQIQSLESASEEAGGPAAPHPAAPKVA
jgi:type VI secretion system FHA domain protein